MHSFRIACIALLAAALAGPALAQRTKPSGDDEIVRIAPVDFGAWGPLPQIGGDPVRYDDMVSGKLDPPPPPAGLSARRLADAEFARAEKLLRIGRRDQIFQALRAAVAADPRHVGAQHLLARMLMFESQFEDALAPASAAIEASGGKPTADLMATRASAYLALGALSQAVEDARAAMKLDRNHPVGPRVMMEDAIARGAYDAAADIARKALAAMPNEYALQLRFAEIALVSGDAATAERIYSQAIDREPFLYNHWYGRAKARLALGRAKQALEDLDAVLGGPGRVPLIPHGGRIAAEILLKRAALHAQLGAPLRGRDDVKAAVYGGGVRVVLQMQIFLRRNGHPEAPLNGVADEAFQGELTRCLSSADCAKKIFDLYQPTIDQRALRRA